MHDVDVDQSGRTDKLAMDTVLAFSDRIQDTILISKAVKRGCYDHLKARGVRKGRIGVRLFIAGLVLLLQDHIAALETVTIDQEYAGAAQGDIKSELVQRLRQFWPDFRSDQVVLRSIGKKSRAHRLALETYRGKRQPDRRVGVEEVLGALS